MVSLQIQTYLETDWDHLEKMQSLAVEEVTGDHHRGIILLSEPSATYTYGASARSEDLFLSEAQAARSNIKIRRVSRGGQWTFHGPGQILIYPIFYLPSIGFGKRDIRKFIEFFRSELIIFFKESAGLALEPREKPFGLYHQASKIASFGMNFQNGISSHGVALYLTPQKPFFEGIKPCGCESQDFTSLQELGFKVDKRSLCEMLGNHLKESFSRRT